MKSIWPSHQKICLLEVSFAKDVLGRQPVDGRVKRFGRQDWIVPGRGVLHVCHAHHRRSILVLVRHWVRRERLAGQPTRDKVARVGWRHLARSIQQLIVLGPPFHPCLLMALEKQSSRDEVDHFIITFVTNFVGSSVWPRVSWLKGKHVSSHELCQRRYKASS